MLAPPDEPGRPATVYDPGIRYYTVCPAEQLHEGNNSRLRGPVLQLYTLPAVPQALHLDAQKCTASARLE